MVHRLHTKCRLTGVDEVERAKNRSKSTVRSKVEHVFAVMKLKFGFVKLRFRGLKKIAVGMLLKLTTLIVSACSETIVCHRSFFGLLGWI